MKIHNYKYFYETICDTSPVGMFRTDISGNISYVNKKFEDLTGKKTSDLLNDGWKQCIYFRDVQKVLSEWERCIENNLKFVKEFRLVKDKSIVWVLGQASPTEDNEGFVGTITNINKRKKLIEELKQLKGKY